MKVALFSDVHGRLRIVLQLIRTWQMTHQTYLDGALIAGDLGAFPDIAKADKATRRWMESDPEEAGFSKFFVEPQTSVENMLAGEHGEFSDIRCPIYFVPGNHEDYSFLISKRVQAGQKESFPVDCYQRFNCIQDGAVINIQGQDGNLLRVAGIWGIENTAPNASYQIKPSVVRRLESLSRGQFDLLLTHDASESTYPTGGSKQIARVIKACQPRFHLFGHVHPIGGQHEFNSAGSQTTSFILKDVSFGKAKTENLCGSLGLLEWNGSSAKLSLVTDGWLKQMNYHTWEQVLPEIAVA